MKPGPKKERAFNLAPAIMNRITANPYVTYKELSEEFGISEAWICAVIRKNGFKRISRPMFVKE